MKREQHNHRDQEDHLAEPVGSATPSEAIEGSTVEPTEDSTAAPMKCLSSGYPNYDHSCRSRIPASVVVKAWQREVQLKGTLEGFFYFSWRTGVWLAYGLPDGRVRGVYCPTHCSERDARDGGEPEIADGSSA